MKLFMLLMFAIVVGCVQAPKVDEYSLNLKPISPDQSLNEDEQFLKKAQESLTETADNKPYSKTFLNP